MPAKPSLTTKLLILYNVILITALIALFVVINGRQPPGGIAGDLFTSARATVASLLNRPLCPDCNVILVSLDTLSANHLPCYGYSRITAPQLCTYAQSNILFSHAYSNATYTLPSHVSLFTGLLPDKHGVNVMNKDRLDPSIPFLPELLKNAGYQTYFYMAGSNHLPVDKVYNRGIDSVTNAFAPSDWKDGLERLANNTALGKKTFLFLHSYFVHAPYIPISNQLLYAKDDYANIIRSQSEYEKCTNEFAAFFRKNLSYDIETGFWGDKTAQYKTYLDDMEKNGTGSAALACRYSDLIGQYRERYYWSTIDIHDPGQVKELKDLYDQRINELDQQLSDLLTFVNGPKYRNNTVVIFTSDHGEEFMEHGEVQHTTLYDSNTHILLAMHIPGVGKKTISSLAQSIDVTPTILDLLDIKPHAAFQGESLVPALGGTVNKNKYVISQAVPSQRETIRSQQDKLFMETRDDTLRPYELYDMIKDPYETNNIIYTSPALTTQLRDRYTAITTK